MAAVDDFKSWSICRHSICFKRSCTIPKDLIRLNDLFSSRSAASIFDGNQFSSAEPLSTFPEVPALDLSSRSSSEKEGASFSDLADSSNATNGKLTEVHCNDK